MKIWMVSGVSVIRLCVRSSCNVSMWYHKYELWDWFTLYSIKIEGSIDWYWTSLSMLPICSVESMGRTSSSSVLTRVAYIDQSLCRLTMVNCKLTVVLLYTILQVSTLLTLARPGRSFSWLPGSSLQLRIPRTSSCSLLGPMARGLSSSLHSTLVLMPLPVGTLLVHSPTSCKPHSVSHVFLSWRTPGLIIR